MDYGKPRFTWTVIHGLEFTRICISYGVVAQGCGVYGPKDGVVAHGCGVYGPKDGQKFYGLAKREAHHQARTRTPTQVGVFFAQNFVEPAYCNSELILSLRAA